MAASDARPGGADTRSHRGRGALAFAAATPHRVAAVPPRTLLVVLVAVQWILVASTALTAGSDGSLAIVVPQVVVLLPLALVLVHGTALRVGGRTFAAWAAGLWVVLPFAGILYALPSLRQDYTHQFLPHVLGLADDASFPAMVAFVAALFLTLRALQTGLSVDVALAVGAAGLGATFAPRAALVALTPVVGLAFGGRPRHAIGAAAALAILLGAVWIAVSTGFLADPFAYAHIAGPGRALASLSENFWSGRVIEWLAIAGVAGALRGRRAAGAMIGVALFAAFMTWQVEAVPLATNLSLLRSLLPVWPAITLAVASIPLLVPRRRPVGNREPEPRPQRSHRSGSP